MITPIIKLVPEKRPRFRLRTAFFGAFSSISDSFIKPLLIAEYELVDWWLSYSSSTFAEEELASKASLSV